MKKFILLILLSVPLLCVDFAYPQNSKSRKKEKLKATVIAENSFPLPCVWHPCAVELIVRLDHGQESKPKYARLGIMYYPISSLPNRGFPTEFTNQARKWKFKAVRDVGRNAILEKYLNSVDTDGKDITEKIAMPAWVLLP